MVFNSLDNTYEKLQELNKTTKLYYCKQLNMVDSTSASALDVILADRDRRILHALYKKAYYAYTKMNCVECSEHRILQLDIELGTFLSEMDRKYGG